MAMLKKGVQSNLNSVVEVFNDGDAVCDKCGQVLNLMESTNGKVPCHKCGNINKIKDIGISNE